MVRGALAVGPEAGHDLEVHDCLILIGDPYRKNANDKELFGSTLPSFVRDRRAPAPGAQADKPCPIGTIRLFGEPGGEVDVLLEVSDGRFLASWPRAKSRSHRLLWEALEKTTDISGVQPAGAGHWFAKLREGTALYLAAPSRKERLLVYDVELSYQSQLRLKDGQGGLYEITNGGGACHDVEIYKLVDGTWRVGYAAEVPAGTQPEPEQTEPASRARPADQPDHSEKSTQPAGPPQQAQVSPGENTAKLVKLPTEGSKADAAAAAGRTSGQAAEGAAPSVTIEMVETGVKERLEALVGWKTRLGRLGLSAPEIDAMLAILAEHALDPERLTVVYRLDASDLDRLLPLEVIPVPRKTIRVGLFVLLNADPMTSQETKQLIAQLGDPDWAKREAAEGQLAKLGSVTVPQLKGALKHSDLEIVFRAERLLEKLAPTELKKE